MINITNHYKIINNILLYFIIYYDLKKFLNNGVEKNN